MAIYDYDDDGFRKEIDEFQQLLTISEFSELQSLDVDGLSCFKELAILIEKTNGNILEVSTNTFDERSENTGMLIKASDNNCPKITWLSTHLVPEDFILLKSLLLNCENLKKVILDSLILNENDDDIGDELLDILSKFSPKSLVDVTISENWKYSIDAFERFFESHREQNLHYFGIIHHKDYITEDYKCYAIIVKKYIDEGVIKRSN